jgi:hypothetical protein
MIYVFKTSVSSKRKEKLLKPHLDNLLQNAGWNFDLNDCDKVLRIQSEKDITVDIIHLLKHHRFLCEELE